MYRSELDQKLTNWRKMRNKIGVGSCSCTNTDPEAIFRELGLSQYLGTFIENGFDTWEAILDVQESDLNSLGVKLGHRRKLQRQIAVVRDMARQEFLEQSHQYDVGGPSGCRHNPKSGVKRKYKRHPKPDANAPVRPFSAYMLFSNKTRDDLKSLNLSLTFIEIAKLVGKNWQELTPANRDIYESQANTAKDTYNSDMVAYKKTSQSHKYSHYLSEFKEKQENRDQDKVSKRIKDGRETLRHDSSSSTAPAVVRTVNDISSGSDKENSVASAEPRQRHNRIDSSASTSMTGSHPPPICDILACVTPVRGGGHIPPQQVGGESQLTSHDSSPLPSHKVAGHHLSTAPTHSVIHRMQSNADGGIPIHALLSEKQRAAPCSQGYDYYDSPARYSFPQDALACSRTEGEQKQSDHGGIITTPAELSRESAETDSCLDGMGALLRADELVRQYHSAAESL